MFRFAGRIIAQLVQSAWDYGTLSSIASAFGGPASFVKVILSNGIKIGMVIGSALTASIAAAVAAYIHREKIKKFLTTITNRIREYVYKKTYSY